MEYRKYFAGLQRNTDPSLFCVGLASDALQGAATNTPWLKLTSDTLQKGRKHTHVQANVQLLDEYSNSCGQRIEQIFIAAQTQTAKAAPIRELSYRCARTTRRNTVGRISVLRIVKKFCFRRITGVNG